MSTSTRRYDMDWLRVIAIGLLLIYHIAIVFQPWGVFIQFMQNDQPLDALWIPMAFINIWRIPLLFFVSGMGVAFAIRKRTWKQLILERTQRIFIPFVFGMLFIVPLHIMLWQKYYHQDVRFSPHPSHLWFLANIFVYVLLLSPVFFYLKRKEAGRVNKWIRRLFRNPLGLMIVLVPFMLEVVVVHPETFEMYAMTPHGFWLGLLAFFFGFCFVLNGETFWQTVLQWRWWFLLSAAVLFGIRLAVFDLQAPHILTSVESNLWIFSAFGFANKYLNRPGKTLNYLRQGAYPIYIIHMIFLYLGSFLILPLYLPAMLKFVLIIAFTGLGCFVMYDLVIKRIRIIRPLFGLRKI